MPPCVVQLGRYGDILNILPLIETMATAERPTLCVSQDFRDITEAVDYCNFEIFPGKFHEHRAAIEFLKRKYPRIISSQVYGDGISVIPQTESFCMESYYRAGYYEAFLRGNFDRININVRRREDEAALIAATIPNNGLPNILVNLTAGYSSPFVFAKLFQSRLEKNFAGRANIIDLSKVRAKRFTDLLGLYDHARLLITADTGTLHLAGAHEVPYIAFVTDRPNVWYGAYSRSGCVARFRYGSAPFWSKTFDQICESALAGLNGRRFAHIYSVYDTGDAHTLRRHRIAKDSWRLNACLGCWWDWPVHNSDLPRVFQDGDRQVPYVKDLLDYAAARVYSDNDLIVLTNTDTCFSADLTELLNYRQLAVGRRRDFQQLSDILAPNEVRNGQPYCGADLFAMTAGWWKAHRDEFPDMIIGCEAWDAVLAQLMLRRGAEETWDFVYHERHPSHWEQPHNKYSLPGQIHNLRLAATRLREWGLDPGRFGIRDV